MSQMSQICILDWALFRRSANLKGWRVEATTSIGMFGLSSGFSQTKLGLPQVGFWTSWVWVKLGVGQVGFVASWVCDKLGF